MEIFNRRRNEFGEEAILIIFHQVRSKDERRPTVNELANQKYDSCQNKAKTLFQCLQHIFMTSCLQVCLAKDQWLEDLPPGGWHGGHRRYGERVEQEAARGDGGS